MGIRIDDIQVVYTITISVTRHFNNICGWGVILVASLLKEIRMPKTQK